MTVPDRPFIALAWALTKAGKLRKNLRDKHEDPQPIHPELLAQLAAVRPVGDAGDAFVFGCVPTLRTFRRDLKRANIERCDDGDRALDLHALKTTFVSMLRKAGGSEQEQKYLARHASKGVTARYQDLGLLDVWGPSRNCRICGRTQETTSQ